MGEACDHLGIIIQTIEHGDFGRLIAARKGLRVLAVIRRQGRQLILSCAVRLIIFARAC